MKDFLSQIGLMSIALLILYIAKKVHEYFYYKELEKVHYSLDDDDDIDDDI